MSHTSSSAVPANTDDPSAAAHRRTLIYPGAGWDATFLPYMQERGYTHFTLYDALPATPHYEPGMVGWEYTKTPEVFFKALATEFGDPIHHDVDQQVITFPNNVTYHNNCDVEAMQELPLADILLKGFCPASWHSKGLYGNKVVFGDCTTYLFRHVTYITPCIVHLLTADYERCFMKLTRYWQDAQDAEDAQKAADAATSSKKRKQN